jgi:hypothetical protein
MRVLALCSLGMSFVCAACGGPAKPVATEANVATADSLATPSPVDPKPPSWAGVASSAPVADATETTAPTPPPAPAHPAPTVSGNIDGKPFAPRLAQVSGPMQKDGRLLISFTEADDCVTSADAKAGGATLLMMVPWKDGAKLDLAKLKAPNPKAKGFAAAMGEVSFIRISDDGKGNQVSTTFKPTGKATIVSAPMEQNAIGKMTLDLKSGDYALSGDVDIKVCFPPK